MVLSFYITSLSNISIPFQAFSPLLSADGSWRQFNAKLRCSEEGNFIQCRELNWDIQQGWEIAQRGVLHSVTLGYGAAWLRGSTARGRPWTRCPWGRALLWVHSSVLLQPGLLHLLRFRHWACSTVLWRDVQGSSCRQGSTASLFSGKRKWAPWAGWELPFCPHANEDSKSSQFDWPRRHCPDWSEWSCCDWLVKMLMGM